MTENILTKQQRKALWIISLMSFCWSTSSLMVFSILPTYMSEKLGITHTGIGWIEGLAVAAAFVTKVLSGIGSDLIKKRSPFILWGSIFSVLSKPIFALSSGLFTIFLARFIDRLSKGVRSAPTDAYIADVSSQAYYGRAYGLRQCLYTGGAAFGALIAMLILSFQGEHYKMIFFLAMIPGCFSVVLALFLKEKKKFFNSKKTFLLRKSHIQQLPFSYWFFLVFVSILMLARFSEAFLILKAKEIGFSLPMLPLVIIVMDLAHAFVTIPAGRLVDKCSAKWVLLFGVGVFAFTHYYISTIDKINQMFIGLVFVGVHMGITQGAIKTIIAEKTPKSIRGSAFAIFHLVCGFFVLMGNAIAGALSDVWGLAFTFKGGYTFTLLAFLVLFSLICWEKISSTSSVSL